MVKNNNGNRFWKIVEKVTYYGALLIVGIFYVGGTRQKVQQKITSLEDKVAIIEQHEKEQNELITKMNLQGSVATTNFINNYELEQGKQYKRLDKLEEQNSHLENLSYRIKRLEEERKP